MHCLPPVLLTVVISLLTQTAHDVAVEPADAGVIDLTALAERVTALEDRNKKLERQLSEQREALRETDAQLLELSPLKARLTGYADVGFFYVEGDGSGLRADFGHRRFPEYRGAVQDSWVFMGDPLSTAINSRGDPADTGDSRAVVFDPIDSQGRPTFLVNNVSLWVFGGYGDSLSFTAAVDFLPRTRLVSTSSGAGLGDFVDVKLAYLEYRLPFERVKLSIFAGRFDPVFGYEYRIQESPDRITVTPSLICRYTCGRPTGVKVRAKLFDERLAANLAVTNGSSFSEGFAFFTETDTNFFKTVSGRISYRFPLGAGLEIGASGMVGAQDAQGADDIMHWQYGFDLHAEIRDFDITAEFVKGLAPGRTEGRTAADTCGAAPCIGYVGAYGQVGWRVTNVVMPYVRSDWREAMHRDGASFVYVSRLVRATAGARFEVDEHLILKAEYTFNVELGGIPQFPNNVFTTSVVVKL